MCPNKNHQASKVGLPYSTIKILSCQQTGVWKVSYPSGPHTVSQHRLIIDMRNSDSTVFVPIKDGDINVYASPHHMNVLRETQIRESHTEKQLNTNKETGKESRQSKMGIGVN